MVYKYETIISTTFGLILTYQYTSRSDAQVIATSFQCKLLMNMENEYGCTLFEYSWCH